MLGKIIRVTFFVLMLSLGGCLYANVKTPLDQDLNQTELGSKIGRSNAYSILGLVSWGDAGTRAAAMDGDLKVINHMDVEYYIILLGLYTRRTTIVYGD